jgi:hypothetical protein
MWWVSRKLGLLELKTFFLGSLGGVSTPSKRNLRKADLPRNRAGYQHSRLLSSFLLTAVIFTEIKQPCPSEFQAGYLHQ